jgi:ABC-type protease/lipase transport system fused ATPase/permease subunit
VGAKVEQKEIDLSTLSKKELRKHLRQQKKLKKAQGKCFHRSFVLFNRVSMLTCFWTCSILFYLVLSCSILFYLVLSFSLFFSLFYLVLLCCILFSCFQERNSKISKEKPEDVCSKGLQFLIKAIDMSSHQPNSLHQMHVARLLKQESDQEHQMLFEATMNTKR